MTIEFDEHGKYFTDIVTKIGIAAVIQTLTHRIEGVIHVRPDKRIKDELDHDEPFMAVTNARVYDLRGELLYDCKFMTVNRAQVIWVIPHDAYEDSDGGEG
jgi:hypothetical protein